MTNTFGRAVPLSAQVLLPRCRPVPVTTQPGELTPVRAGTHAATTFMRCPLGHVRPYQNTRLRQSAKAGAPMKCTECKEIAREK